MAALLPLEVTIIFLDDNGKCEIPPLDKGLVYTLVSAGGTSTVLLRNGGSAATIGEFQGLPLPEPGICYVGDLTCGRHLTLQLEFVAEGDAVTLICSTLAGEECFRLTVEGVDSAWETHKRIAVK